MPDIAMCKNTTCKKNTTCYRYQATPGHWQSYTGFKPNDKGECEYYWKIELDSTD